MQPEHVGFLGSQILNDALQRAKNAISLAGALVSAAAGAMIMAMSLDLSSHTACFASLDLNGHRQLDVLLHYNSNGRETELNKTTTTPHGKL